MGVNVRQNIVTNGLVLYLDAGSRKSYPGSGSLVWTDLSGNGRDITLTRSGSIGSFPTFDPSNQGIVIFDGTGSYGSGSAITGLGSSDRTINCWIKIDTVNSASAARILTLSTDDSIADSPAFVFRLDNNRPRGEVGTGGSPYNGYMNLNLATGSWWNVCTTITATKIITAYQNGIFYSSVTSTGAVGPNPILQISRYNGFYGQYNNSKIGMIQIYNRVLTPSEIAQNYNAVKTRFGLT